MDRGQPGGGYLPDFCSAGATFSVVLIGELLALVVSLVPLASRDFWLEFAYVSLFVQWVGLSVAALLCLLRRPLARLSEPASGVAAAALVLALTALYTEVLARLLLDAPAAMPVASGARADLMVRNLAIAGIIAGLALRYFYVRHQWQRNVELQARAHYQALQARIRPHFLFNSMNTIASLTRTHPELAERVVEDLAALFRVALAAEGTPVALERELELTRRYLDIETLRLGPRLEARWSVAEGLEALRVPPLTLQPLVENAVYHGIEPALAGGWVAITASREGGSLVLRVENTLPEPPRGEPREGNRLAQDNVRQRLEALFPGRCGFTAGPADGGYRVEVRLPAQEGPP